MQLIEIPVDKLEFGMYVSKLDRPWTGTPFVFQGFVLKNERQVDALKKFCKVVYVDPEKAEVMDVTRVTAEDLAKVRGNTVYKEAASVEAEFPRAAQAFTKSTTVVRELSRAVQTGSAIDSPKAKEAATQITESVSRNPDAMALLVKLQEKRSEILSRSAEISVTMTIFGRFLQLPPPTLEMLGMLGLLQDVGKLRLPAEIAERGSINPAEIEIYRTHVEHSSRIVRETPGLPDDLHAFVALHHERFNGTGYPRGLKGDAIALVGQIAGLVDTYDTLTAPKPLGEALSPASALSIIYKERGKLFHAALVEQFIQCIGVYPVGSVVELNSGDIGVVITQNMVRRMQPRIMIVKDAKGVPVIPHRMLDLMREPKWQADEPYRIMRTVDDSTVNINPRELFL
jgi:HD-GYP domain-containing protein (c-di-GMP phosphodiesterase class II)